MRSINGAWSDTAVVVFTSSLANAELHAAAAAQAQRQTRERLGNRENMRE